MSDARDHREFRIVVAAALALAIIVYMTQSQWLFVRAISYALLGLWLPCGVLAYGVSMFNTKNHAISLATAVAGIPGLLGAAAAALEYGKLGLQYRKHP